MKLRILGILRDENKIVSGEMLRLKLNISRVSVWKHIQGLKKLGYRIDSFPKGYRLVSSPDSLFPWEFGVRAPHIHYFDQLSSTMDAARNLARNGCPDFTVVIAEQQTKGRGRLARTWISDAGGLYFSVILRPPIPPVLSFRVNFAASLTLVKILKKMFAVDASVKWPNDILINQAKLSGMLSEMEAEADRVSFINLGIGINVNNDPDPKEQKAASLKNILGHALSRKDLLAAFLDGFQLQMKNIGTQDVIPEWRNHCSTLNQPVKIVTLHETFEGIAKDVDESGALILEQKNGVLKKIIYGDCFYRN
jgi:BirA family transcriptional regulator, biotin operon repressor / biotin---[acetyl-CoA-carboxylase] ligase